MSTMANPLEALIKYQEQLNASPIDSSFLDENGYVDLFDVRPNGGRRFSYVKIIGGDVQALAIFGSEDSINGVNRFSIGYAVSEDHRGRGLAIEAVNRGIENLKNRCREAQIESFYVEALVDRTNKHSLEVAKKLFPSPGEPAIDESSGTPSIYFIKLVLVR